MNQPLITIGITCYREGDWLQECWQSVLAQTDDRWEAVLVMDGGADARTREIFAQLEHAKLRKFAFAENVGPYPVRNKAFALTDTPYHFYVDGDDQLLPTSASLVLDGFARCPEAGCVYGDCEIFGSQSSVMRIPEQITPEEVIHGIKPPGTSAYRKQVWEQVGGFADELACGCGDYDFYIGMMEQGMPWHHCGSIFYRYRIGQSGHVSQSYRTRYQEKIEIMIKRHPTFFQEETFRHRFLAWGYGEAAVENYRAGNIAEACRLADIAAQHQPAEGTFLHTLAAAGGLSGPLQRLAINAIASRRRVGLLRAKLMGI